MFLPEIGALIDGIFEVKVHKTANAVIRLCGDYVTPIVTTHPCNLNFSRKSHLYCNQRIMPLVCHRLQIA